jgi:hypothetical protein
MAFVRWHEGMFLRPQHFQWEQFAHDELRREAHLLFNPLAYGVRTVEFRGPDLQRGVLAIDTLHACLPDGTVVRYPEKHFGCTIGPILDMHEINPPQKEYTVVCWVATSPRSGEPGNLAEGVVSNRARWQYAMMHDVSDEFTSPLERVADGSFEHPSEECNIHIARLHVHVVPQNPDGTYAKNNQNEYVSEPPPPGCAAMPLAKVVHIDGARYKIDETFVPPLLGVNRSCPVFGAVAELYSNVCLLLEKFRGEMMRVPASGKRLDPVAASALLTFCANLASVCSQLEFVRTVDQSTETSQGPAIDPMQGLRPLEWYIQVSAASRLISEAVALYKRELPSLRTKPYKHDTFGKDIVEVCRQANDCLGSLPRISSASPSAAPTPAKAPDGRMKRD